MNNILERNTFTNVITIRAGRDYETNEFVEMGFAVEVFDPQKDESLDDEKTETQADDQADDQAAGGASEAASDEEVHADGNEYFDLERDDGEDTPGFEHPFQAADEESLERLSQQFFKNDADEQEDGIDAYGTVLVDNKLVVVLGMGGYINVSQYANLRATMDGRRVFFLSTQPIKKHDILTVRAAPYQTVMVPYGTTTVGSSTLGASIGFGVFANKDFDDESVIEVANAYTCSSNSKMDDYAFVFEKTGSVILKGNLSLINHSYTPNAYVFMDNVQGILLKAKNNIKMGDELFINYGRSWFHNRGQKPLKT